MLLQRFRIPLVKEAFQPVIPDQTEAIEECYSQGKDYMDKQLRVALILSINRQV